MLIEQIQDLNVIVPASNLSELDWGYGFKVSTQYEAPFHMILHVAACHRNFLRGDFSAPENTSYMLKALQLVKNDISNTETQYSIGAIRGVCYLAMAEVGVAFPPHWSNFRQH